MIKGKRTIKHVLFDTNHWKSFVHSRLGVSKADSGCLYLLGKESKKEQHRMIAEHLTAETMIEVEAKGRKVDEWRPIPNRDNHFLDVVVMSAVAASILGAKLFGTFDPGVKTKAKIDPSKSVRRRLT